MQDTSAREALDRLIQERGDQYGALSRLIGRNPAYIQQYIKRGSPRKLDEADRRILARYFGVDEKMLGAPDAAGAVMPSKSGAQTRRMVTVPRLELGASAGSGSLDEGEAPSGAFAFDAAWLRDMGVKPDVLSIIKVDGESMAPTLDHGDDIMVDRNDGAARLRDGIYVLRLDGVLMVKRVALGMKRGSFSVRSDNTLYPDWEDIDPSLVAIVGRVVWAGRRLG